MVECRSQQWPRNRTREGHGRLVVSSVVRSDMRRIAAPLTANLCVGLAISLLLIGLGFAFGADPIGVLFRPALVVIGVTLFLGALQSAYWCLWMSTSYEFDEVLIRGSRGARSRTVVAHSAVKYGAVTSGGTTLFATLFGGGLGPARLVVTTVDGDEVWFDPILLSRRQQAIVQRLVSGSTT